jgi:tetratricopeptide (TPR) repeat protein
MQPFGIDTRYGHIVFVFQPEQGKDLGAEFIRRCEKLLPPDHKLSNAAFVFQTADRLEPEIAVRMPPEQRFILAVEGTKQFSSLFDAAIAAIDAQPNHTTTPAPTISAPETIPSENVTSPSPNARQVFLLDLTINESARNRELCIRLLGSDEEILARQQILIRNHPATTWEGLIAPNLHLQRFGGNVEPESGAHLDEHTILTGLGTFLARHVLGPEIMGHLSYGDHHRTICVRLPNKPSPAALLLACIPWEMAQIDETSPTLAELGIVVRILPTETTTAPPDIPIAQAPLRILFVFTETSGQQALAARLERARIIALFRQRIFPRYNVEIDILCYGVSRGLLSNQIKHAKPYHIVHWSGHGHKDQLLIASDRGDTEYLNGEELVSLFAAEAGYLPKLVFLATCHSGSLTLSDWPSFQAAVEQRDTELQSPAKVETEADFFQENAHRQHGYSGVAYALVAGSVPCTVAMRYEVTDDYGRDLAVRFYDHLFSTRSHLRVEEALIDARKELIETGRHTESHGYIATDQFAPLLFGSASLPASILPGPPIYPSAEVPPQFPGFDPDAQFVGRSRELGRLHAHWIRADDAKPLALIHGLGGLGKTALAAEAVTLWYVHFQRTFIFRVSQLNRDFDYFLQTIHGHLLEISDYAEHVRNFPADAVWQPPSPTLDPAQRRGSLLSNFLRVLTTYRILLVIDNFEICLTYDTSRNEFVCDDVAWGESLVGLATTLIGTTSRVLLTCRHRIGVLASHAVENISLGPLSIDEAAVFVRTHPALRRIYFDGLDGRELAIRLLEAARGHPLLLDRLAKVATSDSEALAPTLEVFEKSGLQALATIFSPASDDAAQSRYLEEALCGSTDVLLDRVGSDCRRILWTLSLAIHPLTKEVWEAASSGRDKARETLKNIKRMLDERKNAPEALQKALPQLPASLARELSSLQENDDPIEAKPVDFDAKAASMVTLGLVSRNDNAEWHGEHIYQCHEVVRERITSWMAAHPDEMSGRRAEDIWMQLGLHCEDEFNRLMVYRERGNAVQHGALALLYFVRAKAFEKIDDVVPGILGATESPAILNNIIYLLGIAISLMKSGVRKAKALNYLASATSRAGNSLGALPIFEQATLEMANDPDPDQLGLIVANWAGSFMKAGQLARARDKYREAARLLEKSGGVMGIMAELEATMLDLRINPSDDVARSIISKFDEVKKSAEEFRANPVIASVLLRAMEVMYQTCLELRQWKLALDTINMEIEHSEEWGVSEYDRSKMWYNRAIALMRLGDLSGSAADLMRCIPVFKQYNDINSYQRALSLMSLVEGDAGDVSISSGVAQRALAGANASDDIIARAVAHYNLSNQMFADQKVREASFHHTAALMYFVVAQDQGNFSQVLDMFVRRSVHVRPGLQYRMQDLSEFLQKPEFAPFVAWVRSLPLDPHDLHARLQAAIQQRAASLGPRPGGRRR